MKSYLYLPVIKMSTNKYCFIKICSNTSFEFPEKNFFTVPNSNKAAWCAAVGLHRVPTRSLYVCEDHLNLEEDLENYQFWKTMNVRARLKPRLPFRQPFQNTTICLQPSHTSQLEITDKLTPEPSSFKSVGVMYYPQVDHKKTQIKTRMADRSTNCCLKKKYVKKTIHLQELQSVENSSPLTGNTTSTDVTDTKSSAETDKASKKILIGRSLMIKLVEKKPMAYIGIPKKCYWVVAYLEKQIKTLSYLDIIVTLYKLRSNNTFTKIADLFQMSVTTMWRTYCRTLAILSKFFRQFIYWPPSVEIKTNLPNAFKINENYSKVESIINCFEIEIEKPLNVVEQSLTWSQYRGCNTAKYLISATPNGFINYVSNGYGGRISDENLVEESKFVQAVPQNCVILADKGFKHLETILWQKGIKLMRPPSDKKQNKQEVLETNVIASLHRHIERVIRRVRTYRLLKPHATMNNKLINMLDDVVCVACGLINLQSSIIKRA